ncbi:universal stress protein [Diaphorobacter ruginosibacter]|uniref:Universal stress protein n=1 Tax=Diaphorobacter ruginosibacter TaxID=1715720 RepID=A0A7G9RNM6_9BURK|nr:universal stress protein [Diaphorobacter ruginosibacter]QNN57201.1 universal stress protein [Diaphorobacter ruginosibacter]
MVRILVAVDGSELALDAVRHALTLVGEGLKAVLVLGHVQEEASFLELATQGADAIAEAAVEAGKHLTRPAERLVREASVPFETEIVLGSPASALCDLAESQGCDFIVMGARGLGAMRAAVMGSVSLAVVQHSTLPVLVVKHREASEADEMDEDAQDTQA